MENSRYMNQIYRLKSSDIDLIGDFKIKLLLITNIL